MEWAVLELRNDITSVTNFMEQSPSGKGNQSSDTLEISPFY